MNAENLEKNQPVELVDGARQGPARRLQLVQSCYRCCLRFRFGGLPELFVYREPPAAEEEAEEPSSPPVVAEAL